MFKRLNNDEIEKLLLAQVVGRIGCHADDITYVVPVSYAYDGEFIYGRTFEGKKLDMMRKNPRICFQVDDTHDLSNWQSVICWGSFEELETDNERQVAVQALQSRRIPLISSQTMELSNEFPFSVELENVKGVLFRVRISEKTGMAEISKSSYYYAT